MRARAHAHARRQNTTLIRTRAPTHVRAQHARTHIALRRAFVGSRTSLITTASSLCWCFFSYSRWVVLGDRLFTTQAITESATRLGARAHAHARVRASGEFMHTCLCLASARTALRVVGRFSKVPRARRQGPRVSLIAVVCGMLHFPRDRDRWTSPTGSSLTAWSTRASGLFFAGCLRCVRVVAPHHLSTPLGHLCARQEVPQSRVRIATARSPH